MKTLAHHAAVTAELQYTGTLAQPAELRSCEGKGHTIVMQIYPSSQSDHIIIVHSPIAPTPAAYHAAERVVDEINAAAKHGDNTITVAAALQHQQLHLRQAHIVAHAAHHPASAAPQRAPQVVKVADLFV